jgi:hypothetical protein
MPTSQHHLPVQFKKRLEELTPPLLKRHTAYERFTADLQLLNHFLWSTELAMATVLSDYREFEDSTEQSHTLLSASSAQALKPRGSSKSPHYRASMGSLLVQLRWNYDTLARWVLIDSVSICEDYVNARVTPILGSRCPSSFAALFERLRGKNITVDPLPVVYAQLYKVLRNSIVHERSTIHSFPSRGAVQAVKAVCERALSWSAGPSWSRRVNGARHEVFTTTRETAKVYDVPQLFFAAIFALTRFRALGDAIERAITAALPDGDKSP